MILREVKKIVKDFTGLEIEDAVISVPGYFDKNQIQATANAVLSAGLKVLGVVQEPHVAAVAYHILGGKSKKNILVYHLGGGTCDVSVLQIIGEEYELYSNHSDTHLVGKDFDENILRHFMAILKSKYGKDISKDASALRKLLRKFERAKISLSRREKVLVKSESLLGGGVRFSETLTRANFEELNYKLFTKTMRVVEKALESADLHKSNIAGIVLVGGSESIPKFKETLENFFDGNVPVVEKRMEPEIVVAFGVARHAIELHLKDQGASRESVSMEVDG